MSACVRAKARFCEILLQKNLPHEDPQTRRRKDRHARTAFGTRRVRDVLVFVVLGTPLVRQVYKNTTASWWKRCGVPRR
jgi:hypothetical protein